MGFFKVCPSCNTPNEYSAQKCVGCAADIPHTGPEEESTVLLRNNDGMSESSQGRIILSARDGKVIEVKDGDVIGRNAIGKELFEPCEEVSRRHARFVRRGSTWSVIDLGSSNGTFLDGVRIPSNREMPVRHLQTIKFSPVFEVLARIEPAEEEQYFLSANENTGGVENNRRTMVILFADLKGSVNVFQEKGTIMARNWIFNLYHILTAVITSHKGMHIKNIGDAILAVFDDPCEAARAALEMQADLKKHNARTDEADRYYIRIGMNIGTVLFENNDVFGNSVNIAARVQAITPPECIFITGGLYDVIKENMDIQFRHLGDEQLKGVRERTAIYEILEWVS